MVEILKLDGCGHKEISSRELASAAWDGPCNVWNCLELVGCCFLPDALLVVFRSRNPELVIVPHQVSKNRPSHENHLKDVGYQWSSRDSDYMFSSCRSLDADFKLLKNKKVGTTLKALPTPKFSVFPRSTRAKYSCFKSRSNRLGNPGYIVEPPDRTMCLNNSRRQSKSRWWCKNSSKQTIPISAPWMASNKSSDRPDFSTSIKCGWKRTSGASNLSAPTLMTRPSGN